MKARFLSAIALLAAFEMAGCGGGGTVVPPPPPPPNPTPSISSITPGFVAMGSAGQTLTINGGNFSSASTVSLNNSEHAATFVSSTRLTIPLSASDQASAACYAVTVTNPTPGGGTSNSANFEVRDPASPVYVIDLWNHRVEVFDSNGNYVSQFDHSFDMPLGITTDCQHNIYVQDGNTHCSLDKFDHNTNFLSEYGVCLVNNGFAGPGVFDNVSMVATDGADNVWVASPDFFYIQKYDGSGKFQSIVCMAVLALTVNCPWATPFDVQGESIAVDTVGNIWLVNENPGIAPPVIEFDSTGKYLAAFESWGAGNGQFSTSITTRIELTLDGQGNIYLTDPGNNRVQKFDSQGNYLSQFGSQGTGDGQFNNPAGIDIDANGNVYVADVSNNRVEKFDANGNYLSQFGTSGTGNGQFHFPFSLAVVK